MSATASASKALADAASALRLGHDRDADREIAKAQALALIAIAEEQHTANLIAVFAEEGPEVFHEPAPAAMKDVPYSILSADREERIRARYLVLAAEIAERLDLA